MRRYRNTKIVSTIGPASSSSEMLEKLFEAGADVFRLNFSHGTHDDHKERYNNIRKLEEKFGRPTCILADLQGPKLRVGKFANGKVNLETGKTFRLDLDAAPGDEERVQLPHPEIFAAMEKGTVLLLDDGKLRLEVREFGKDYAVTTIVNGGVLSDRKGVNVPNAILPLAALTEKDLKDLEFAMSLGVDWVALSFVQKPEDMNLAREKMAATGKKAALLAKIEKPSAIDYLDEIIEASDGIMVARGDLGVEMFPEDVPPIQKRIVRGCRAVGKPVIVATQMLESMINAPTPTRAEASDVANAVYDGADAVMLSAETASGDFPVEAVTIMSRIIQRVEIDPLYRKLLNADPLPAMQETQYAITHAASEAAKIIDAKAIVTFTTSGTVTLRTVRDRPVVPIIASTEEISVARRLSLSWGVHATHACDIKDFIDMVEKAAKLADEQGFAEKGEKIIITAGVPFGIAGSTNMIRIEEVK